jgi:hypothetical protein
MTELRGTQNLPASEKDSSFYWLDFPRDSMLEAPKESRIHGAVEIRY